MIRHHPSQTTLLAFATGALPDLHRQVVAAHVKICPGCASEMRAMEEVGGALLEVLPPTALAPDAFSRVLGRLEKFEARAASPSAPLTLSGLATGRWRWSGPGIAMMPLRARDATDTRLDLIRVTPGTALLEHGHTGFETTMVLQGAFDDGIAQYRVGDFAEADGEIDHEPRALSGEMCICLIATSGHLSARGLMGRLIRPLLGM